MFAQELGPEVLLEERIPGAFLVRADGDCMWGGFEEEGDLEGGGVGDEREPETAYSLGEKEGAGFCVEEDELEDFGDIEYFVGHFFVRSSTE